MTMSYWTDAAWEEANRDARPAGLRFSEVLMPVAAIAHRCDACHGTITPGTRYRREVSMTTDDGAPSVSKTHLDCYSEGEF